jgi:hypothetical protein
VILEQSQPTFVPTTFTTTAPTYIQSESVGMKCDTCYGLYHIVSVVVKVFSLIARSKPGIHDRIYI